MKKTVLTLAAALLCSTAFAHGIEAGEAYAYPTVQGMTQGGAFVSLTNTEKKDDKLIGATASKQFADKIELHTHVNDNGVMRMREVKGGIPHIMFFGLKKPLQEGDKFDLNLKFKNAKPQKITVTVKPMQAGAMPAHDHGAGEAKHAH